MAQHAPLNERDENGMTPLHAAIDARQPDCVALLLRAGADRYVRDRHGRTAFDAAKEIADVNDRAKILLLVWHSGKQGREETAGPPLGSLEHWVMRGSPGVAGMLLDLGADPNAVGASGTYPLSDASLKGDLQLVRQLIARGARVDAVNEAGTQAIHDATLGGHAEVLRELAKHGADVNAATREGAHTPLHIAAIMGKMSAAKMLVALGAKLQAKDAKGQTPLTVAEREGQAEIASFLRSVVEAAGKPN